MRALARLKRVFPALAAGFVLLLAVAHLSPLVPAIGRWLTGQWEEPKGDVLIVLSADQLGDGTLGLVSYWRSVYAVRAWRAGGFQRIVVSGGKLGYPQSPSVAQSMADFIAALGVPRGAIWLEERSLSTRENALFTAALIRDWPGKKVLLTSDCHMRRARLAFARAGIDTVPAPMPDIGKRWNNWLSRWDCSWTVAGELVKFAYYAARGWI
jgi:uncharacterized SAM-binding protein YcdF (DUF218 family)